MGLAGSVRTAQERDLTRVHTQSRTGQRRKLAERGDDVDQVDHRNSRSAEVRGIRGRVGRRRRRPARSRSMARSHAIAPCCDHLEITPAHRPDSRWHGHYRLETMSEIDTPRADRVEPMPSSVRTDDGASASTTRTPTDSRVARPGADGTVRIDRAVPVSAQNLTRRGRIRKWDREPLPHDWRFKRRQPGQDPHRRRLADVRLRRLPVVRHRHRNRSRAERTRGPVRTAVGPRGTGGTDFHRGRRQRDCGGRTTGRTERNGRRSGCGSRRERGGRTDRCRRARRGTEHPE